jgi:ribosome-binding factor A
MAGRRHDNRAAAPYPRTARVNQVLQEILAEEIERRADVDDRLRLVTVTGVEVSPDLRHARVFVGSASEEALDALGAERPGLQRAIARQVRMKRTPALQFANDPAIDHATKVEEILREIHGREVQAEADPGGRPEPDAP